MRIPHTGIALILAASIAWTGCALLLPPSWRGRAPVPLAGAVDSNPASAADATLDPSSLTNERLLQLVEQDRSRLIEFATQVERASESELRAIADRLSLLVRELESRGTPVPGSPNPQPVTR